MTIERSTIQYQTSPRLTLLSKESLSTNEEVYLHIDSQEEGELVDSSITLPSLA